MAFSPIQKLSIGAGAMLLMLAVAGGSALVGITQMMGSERAVAQTNAAIAKLDRVVTRTLDAENAQRGFVSTGDSSFLEPLDSAQNDVEFALDTLLILTDDDPEQRRNLERLGPLIAARFRDVRAGIAIRQRKGLDSATAFMRHETGLRARGGAGSVAIKMRDEEIRVLGFRSRIMTETGRQARLILLVGSLTSLLLALLALQPMRPSVALRLTQRLSYVLQPPPELKLTLDEAARHAGDRLMRLQQIIAALNAPVNAEDVALHLLQKGAPPLVASLGVVARRVGNALVVARSLGRVAGDLATGSTIVSSRLQPFERAEQSGEPVVVASAAERDHTFPALEAFSVDGSGEGAFIAVPLTADGRVRGVLLLSFSGDRVFGDDDRAYLATLGRLGGQALARNHI